MASAQLQSVKESAVGRVLFGIPGRTSSYRIGYFDGLRGFALIVMVYVHGMKCWLAPTEMGPVYLFFKPFIDKVPSALFLFLVGISYVLSRNAKLLKGWPEKKVFLFHLRRSLFLICIAYLYRLVDFLFFIVSWKSLRLASVDVLNIIAVSFFLITVFDYFFSSARNSKIVYFIVASLLVFLTPLMHLVRFPEWVPLHLAAYINGAGPRAYFAVFPTVSFVFFGCYVAEKEWHVKPAVHCCRGAALLFLAGIALYWGVGAFADNSVVLAGIQKLGYYYSVFSFCFVSIGIARFVEQKTGFGPLLFIGSNTMIAYWVHAKIIYIIFGKMRGSSWETSLLLLAVTLLMTYAITLAVAAGVHYWKSLRAKTNRFSEKTGTFARQEA